MNRILIAITLFFCVAMIYSCQSTTPIETTEEGIEVSLEIDEELQTDVSPVDTVIIIEEEPEVGVFLTYNRGYCFGMCPVFKSTILTDGTVNYEGINFVDLMGMNSSEISGADLKLIKDKLKEINYFELEAAYDNEMISDLPSVTTSARLGEKSHSVLDRYKAPKELKELYKLIDDIFATLEWSLNQESE